MANLFNYATKELSQDAFLMWLFNSWQEDECGDIVKRILKKACNISEEIKEIKTRHQEEYIDVTVDIVLANGQKAHLFIEDKTFSSEHKQLTKYDDYINANYSNAYKLFYKTNKINETDKTGVDEANKKNKEKDKSEWQIWDIDKIAEIFGHKEKYQNLILEHYKDYIYKIRDCIENTEKPNSNNDNEDWMRWEGYFNKTIIPKLPEGEYRSESLKAGQYPYICLVLRKKGYEKNVPYLEIRSRDCLNDDFVARLLCYGVPAEDLKNQQDLLIENAKNEGFTTKGLVNYRKQMKIYPKQVGSTGKLKATTDEEFVENVIKWGKKYLNAMKDWK